MVGLFAALLVLGLLEISSWLPRKCPQCGGRRMARVLYAGVPGQFCDCSCLSGPAAWLIDVVGFNGALFVYEGPWLIGAVRMLFARRGGDE